MNNNEKAELLKDTIFQLYVKENRSKSYIGRLLHINRETIGNKIKEWKFPEPETKHYLTPSHQKFINKNRNYIVSQLNKDVSISEISRHFNIPYSNFGKMIVKDDVIKKAHNEYINRIHTKSQQNKEKLKEQSCRTYDFPEIPNEKWKPILGYEGYEISNMGRVRHYIKSYKSYILLSTQNNMLSNRVYVTLSRNSKNYNLSLPRLVAFAFVEGYSKEKNTVNHINGDIKDNIASNLEWTSQSENNKHSYEKLHRKKTYGNQYQNRYKGKIFLYDNQYEFKTITALAKFLNKSWMQTSRYLEEPEKHNIQIIDKKKV